MKKTYDPNLRWNVIQVDYNEQEVGGEYGKHRVMNAKPMRREQAEKLEASFKSHEIHMKEIGSKNSRTYFISPVWY